MARLIRWLARGLVPAIALVGVLLVQASARADDSKVAAWVSADAAIYLEIPHPDQLIDRATGESLQKMLGAIPQYTRFIKSEQYKSFRTIVDFVAGQLGTTWDKGLRKLTGGGIVFALEGEPGKAPRLILAATPSDQEFLKTSVAKLVELARKDAKDKGRPDPIKPFEHRGASGYGLDKGAYAIVDGTLVVSDSAETLKSVIDRARDGAKAGKPITENPEWKARKGQLAADSLAWEFVRLDRLRALDAKKFSLPDKDKTPAQLTFFFGSWVEALRKAPWVAASVKWTDRRLAAELIVPNPPGGYPDSLKAFIPAKNSGAAPLIMPPGTIASVSLWRDFSAIWESRTDLLSPEAVQGLAQLDTTAGQFFGGRDFGTGVLGALTSDWRLVVARQDFGSMKPVPDVKYPAFALIKGLKPEDEEFAQQLKVAFQSFIGLVNLGSAQNKAPPLELASETVEGVKISTSHFIPPKGPDDGKQPVNARHNFTPSVAQVDNYFILSSSAGLARDLVKAIKAPGKPADATLLLEADGPELVKLLDLNRNQLVMQNMLNRGENKAQAEEGVSTLLQLIRYFGHGRLTVNDGSDSVRLALDFALSQ